MTLRDSLANFAGSIAIATSNAPDDYPSWSAWTYETHMQDLRELWKSIRPQLTRDVEKINLIESKLLEMFEAFEAGHVEKGRQAAMSIYNLEVQILR